MTSVYPDGHANANNWQQVVDEQEHLDATTVGLGDDVVTEGEVDNQKDDDRQEVGAEDDDPAGHEVVGGSVVTVLLVALTVADHDASKHGLQHADPTEGGNVGLVV